MRIHAYGNKDKPGLMLLPGNCLNGQDNFGEVIDLLRDVYHVICVCYDGFDGNEKTVFQDMETEAKVIEGYIQDNYGGKLHAVYGSSLGGSLAALLVQRRKIHIAHVMIGSTDFDHPSKSVAWLESRLFAPSFYKMIHTGVPMKSVGKEMSALSAKDSYVKLLHMMGVGHGGLSYVKKESVQNQFYSEWVTKIEDGIDVPGTTFYCFYASRMGEEYKKRYRRHFKNVKIVEHEHNRKSEELLISYPEEWAEEIKRITGMWTEETRTEDV